MPDLLALRHFWFQAGIFLHFLKVFSPSSCDLKAYLTKYFSKDQHPEHLPGTPDTLSDREIVNGLRSWWWVTSEKTHRTQFSPKKGASYLATFALGMSEQRSSAFFLISVSFPICTTSPFLKWVSRAFMLKPGAALLEGKRKEGPRKFAYGSRGCLIKHCKGSRPSRSPLVLRSCGRCHPPLLPR